MTPKMFQKIRQLFRDLDRDNANNAQGDNGLDVRHREEIYQRKLEQLLKKGEQS